MIKMVEIKAGFELDRAVAEAVGLNSIRGPAGFFIDPREGIRAIPFLFQPSVDLNAAFAAAEKAGLFTIERDGPEVHLAKTFDGQWEILTGGSAMGYVSREATPSLAICAAILELAKVNQS